MDLLSRIASWPGEAMRRLLFAAVCSLVAVCGCGGPLLYWDVGWMAGRRAWFGNYSGAAAEMRSNLEMLEAEGRQSYDIARSLGHLSFLCWATNEIDEAVRLGERAVDKAEALPRNNEAILAVALLQRGRAYLANREYDRARHDCERSKEIDELAWTWMGLGAADLCIGEAALGLGERALAQSSIESAYEIRSKARGLYSWITAEALSSRGLLYHEIGQQERAGTDFEEAMKNLASSLPSPSPYEARTLERYAALLEDRGRQVEAEEMRARAAALWSQLGSCKN
jgi:hypothetical protein